MTIHEFEIFKDRFKTFKHILPDELSHPGILALVQLSLAEDLIPDGYGSRLDTDLAAGDVTSTATLDSSLALAGKIRAKSAGVVAGLPVAGAVFRFVGPDIRFDAKISDGDVAPAGKVLAEVSGPGRSILAAERTALNFLGRLSGIATLTRRYVDAVAGTKTVILDTRKTAPGFRLLDKYAVRQGGGQNHRMGLYDMALIKDNHIDGAGGLQAAVEGVEKRYGDHIPIEIEVKDLYELKAALALKADRIMLDNMDLDTMRQAVNLTAGRVPLEASGNVTLETAPAIAETGVDYISVGALTHSAPVLDVSLRL